MKNKSKNQFKVFNFSEMQESPVNRPNKAKGFISWGKGNDYPNFLESLYNHKGSGIHKAIISRKCKMIAGGGINGLENDVYGLDELVSRITLDYEIYNSFAIEVIYANDGSILETNHVSVAQIRKGIPSDQINFPHYWVSTDWSQHRKEEHQPQFIREFNPLIKSGRQLFVYVEYNPSAEVYPIPSYSSILNWVELDYEISRFHLNQAKNGYAPQFILNFASGIPGDEEMDETVRAFKREYQGSGGETIMITFSEGGESKPELIPIQLNDSDERFITLGKDVKENIMVGHEVTNPQLFGIRVPGELGGKSDLLESLEIFQAVYVNQRQKIITDSINSILGTSYSLNLFNI